MNIKIHTMYFLPDFGSAPILHNELATYLASKGHNVEVITTIPREQKRADYRGHLFVREHSNNFCVKRYWTNASYNPIGRFIAWTIYTIWCIINITTIKRGDILVLRLAPLQLGLVGILAKRLKGAKFISNVQDIFPDLAIKSGLLKNIFLINIARRLERCIYDESNEIIVITEDYKRNLLRKGVNPEKIKVIPNWVNTDFFKPLPKNNYIAQRLSLTEKFVVMYSGVISLSNFVSLEKILDAADLLKKEDGIIFVIVGGGMKQKSLEDKAQRLGLNNVKFLPFFPYDDVPYLLASSDCLIVPSDTGKTELAAPSKLYSFIATGRIILSLAEKESEQTKVVTEINCGVCLDVKDVAGIAKTIINLKNSIDYRNALAEKGIKYITENFSSDKILKKYEELISSLK